MNILTSPECNAAIILDHLTRALVLIELNNAKTLRLVLGQLQIENKADSEWSEIYLAVMAQINTYLAEREN